MPAYLPFPPVHCNSPDHLDTVITFVCERRPTTYSIKRPMARIGRLFVTDVGRQLAADLRG